MSAITVKLADVEPKLAAAMIEVERVRIVGHHPAVDVEIGFNPLLGVVIAALGREHGDAGARLLDLSY